jgi:hypothetical protein
MVPNVAGTGTSFKGAALYYLHDKRQDGESERLSSDRVAWSETRNLATNDPELGWKIMAATALDQDRLKSEAGVKNTGRKSAAAVYAYSLSWHPDEKNGLTREEMLAAAEASIAALGAGDRQAIIVAHNDEPHPHVHVILNRVSPTDGRMLGTSNDRLKLSEWALSYRQARGEADKYCPDRAANIEARKKGEYVRDKSETPRGMESEFSGARASNDNSAVKERERQKALNRELAAQTKAMHVRHKSEWQELLSGYRASKEAIFDRAKGATEQARESVKAQFRPSWGELYRRHGIEERDFKSRENTLGGKIGNAVSAIAHRRDLDPDNNRGFVSNAFNYLTSRKAREDALAKLHALERRRLSAEQNRELSRAIARVRDSRNDDLKRNRKSFLTSRDALVTRQEAERLSSRKIWALRKEESGRAFDRVSREQRSKEALQKQSLDDKADAGGRLKSVYERAADHAAAARRRSKERDRDRDKGDRDR